MTRTDDRDGPDVRRTTTALAASVQSQTAVTSQTVTSHAELDSSDTLVTTTDWAEDDPAGNDDGLDPVVEFTATIVDDFDATISGTIAAADVSPNITATAGARTQGLNTGEIDELIAAMRAGATYVNVHSSTWQGGEIRSQIIDHEGHGNAGNGRK